MLSGLISGASYGNGTYKAKFYVAVFMTDPNATYTLDRIFDRLNSVNGNGTNNIVLTYHTGDLTTD